MRLRAPRELAAGGDGTELRRASFDIADDGGKVFPGVGEYLRLPQLLAGDPAGAGGALQEGDLGRLVGFDVGTETDAVLVALRLHFGDVGFHHSQIDGDHWGFQVFNKGQGAFLRRR